MPKNKSHKGLLKRIRITKSGRVKLSRACARHLKSHKSGRRVRQYRRPKFAVTAEIGRLRALLNRRLRAHKTDVEAASTE